jgi:benzoylformate decarboxylase
VSRPGKVALFEQLRADGITHMFGNPGTVEQGFLDVLDSVQDIRYILTLQETVAAGIADGYARATGRPTLLQLHSGVGLGNGIGMLYQAHRGHAPLICVAGESGVQYEAMDAQMAADLVAMARPVTKYATRVTHPGSLLRVLRRAIKMAMTPPRGPVFVALPMDVLDAENDEPVLPTVIPDTRAVADPRLIERAAALLAGAQRPIMLLGDGVAASGAAAQAAAVAELLGAQVWLVDSSEPNMPAGHPLVHGQLGHMFGQVSSAAVADADAVLVVGSYLFPEVFPSLASPFAAGARVVHIDLDAYEIAKNHPVDLGLVADPALTLAALAAELERVLTPEARAAGRDRLAGCAAAAAAAPAPAEDSVLAALLREIAAAVPADVMVFDEALTASPLVARYLPPRLPGHSFLTRGGSLGVGIPGAIGMKLAHPERTVLGFTGDGGSMYTYQALWTAARYGVGAKFVVCNNHRYELLNENIAQYWNERAIAPHRFPTSFDIGHPEIDFVGLAAALGVPGARVDKAEQAEQAVAEMSGHDGPFLIDVATDDLIRPRSG